VHGLSDRVFCSHAGKAFVKIRVFQNNPSRKFYPLKLTPAPSLIQISDLEKVLLGKRGEICFSSPLFCKNISYESSKVKRGVGGEFCTITPYTA
jgi:hypothetical protein